MTPPGDSPGAKPGYNAVQTHHLDPHPLFIRENPGAVPEPHGSPSLSEESGLSGVPHPLCEEETLAFEEPAYGDPSLICEAGQDHGALMFWDCGVAGLEGGPCHWVCGETGGDC